MLGSSGDRRVRRAIQFRRVVSVAARPRHGCGRRPSRELPAFHKGSVDLGTGLYIRENEDLVVAGSPALILRRTYLSGYRVSTQFGIGTTHTGEQYLHGDGHRFQWASLILASGTSVNFRRVSRGTSFYNAMYEHRETSSEWEGARLGWAGQQLGAAKARRKPRDLSGLRTRTVALLHHPVP